MARRSYTSVYHNGVHQGSVQGEYSLHEATIILASQELRSGNTDGANALLWYYKELEVKYDIQEEETQ